MKTGLQDTVVAEQDICFIGPEGDLIYRGYHIDELAPNASYEEVVYLLWHGHLPTPTELTDFQPDLTARRTLSAGEAGLVEAIPTTAHPMAACRTLASHLNLNAPGPPPFERAASLEQAADLLAKLPTLMAAFARARRDLPAVAPRPDLDHAANLLWMLTETEPSPEAVSALNMYFVLLAENDFTASTFATRVTASTWASLTAAVVSGIATLSGDAHGGAQQAVMTQLLDIGSPDQTESWFETAMANKRRLMGVGHRVYKTVDPRVPHLRARVEALAQQEPEQARWFQIAARLEAATAKHPFFQQRKLYPNVDFYAAPLLYMLGLQPDMFTVLFSLSRLAGWTTHIMDQYADNRLIRPRTEYIGPRDLAWTPLEER